MQEGGITDGCHDRPLFSAGLGQTYRYTNTRTHRHTGIDRLQRLDRCQRVAADVTADPRVQSSHGHVGRDVRATRTQDRRSRQWLNTQFCVGQVLYWTWQDSGLVKPATDNLGRKFADPREKCLAFGLDSKSMQFVLNEWLQFLDYDHPLHRIAKFSYCFFGQRI